MRPLNSHWRERLEDWGEGSIVGGGVTSLIVSKGKTGGGNVVVVDVVDSIMNSSCCCCPSSKIGGGVTTRSISDIISSVSEREVTDSALSSGQLADRYILEMTGRPAISISSSVDVDAILVVEMGRCMIGGCILML